MRTTTGWRSTNRSTELTRTAVERRDPRPTDIAVRIDFCGVCHSDLHAIHGADDVVPGHEFTGTVTEVGAEVDRFAVGDRVAVGTIVDSCGVCAMCRAGEEAFCHEFPTLTYGGKDRVDGTTTRGGYSREYVLRADFAYPLPDGLDPAAAAPLMCAGITVWDPLRATGVGPGSRVAVAGMGGLGHLAVRLAAALGAEVTVLSRTPDKAEGARALGATALLAPADAERDSFDVVVDTIPTAHDLGPLLRLVALDGTLVSLGHLGSAQLQMMDLLAGRKRLTSSGVGGRPRTAELLAFAAEHGITAQVEVLPSAQVGQALERLARGDVRYRFVLDLSDLD